MRLVHSLNTKGMGKKSLEVNVYYFTLSALYAKRNGFDIVLHTDIQGAYYLQHAPYDDIICDLGDSPSDYFLHERSLEQWKMNQKEIFTLTGMCLLKIQNLNQY